MLWDFINNYTFAITIIFIVLATLIAAFVRRTRRDKCLKNFAGYMVTLEDTAAKTIWGRLKVENTGIELLYAAEHKDEQGHIEKSYILYKHEYPKISALLRYHDQLSEADKARRQKDFDKTYHPTFMRRARRKTMNIFRTVRDSVAEIITLLIGQAKRATPTAGVLRSQDKYVSQIQQELLGAVGTSYEPLLEKYIGRKVVLELIKSDSLFEYSGVLKEYTADFIELMDVVYKTKDDEPHRIADLIVFRQYGLVRHLGE